MIEMKIHGMTTKPGTHLQILWLGDLHDNVMFPILTGSIEAASVYAALTGKKPLHPLAHDLVVAILEHFGTRVEEVRIVAAQNNDICADLVIGSGKEQMHLEARPSDAIALALRFAAPIYISETVLANSGYAAVQEGRGPCAGLAQGTQQAPVSAEAVSMAIDELLRETGIEEQGQASPQEALQMLEKRLKLAIKLEHYEGAACLQQEIERLKREQQ